MAYQTPTIYSQTAGSAGTPLGDATYDHVAQHNEIYAELAKIENSLVDGYISESATVTYVSTSSFTISGIDRTALYTAGRILRLNSGGTPVYVIVTSSSFSTNTTVNTTGANVPNPLNTVEYGFGPKSTLLAQVIVGGTPAQGDIIYFNGTTWVRLGAGTAGQILQTGGAAANPSWSTRYGSPTTLTDGATVTIDHSLNTLYQVTLGGNRTFAVSNLVTGKPIMLDIIQDSTGSRTVTWFPTTTDTVTMTIATPGVVTTTKDIPTTTPVIFTTTGALPTGITAGTRYYWVRQSSTTGNVATSIANAQAGTVIATSGSQSGTHTMSVQIRWGSDDTQPTLSTGKYRKDTFGFMPIDATNGVVNGYTVGQGN